MEIPDVARELARCYNEIHGGPFPWDFADYRKDIIMVTIADGRTFAFRFDPGASILTSKNDD
jgi:hypothetical protein